MNEFVAKYIYKCTYD
jgi:dynein heavy chain